MHRRSKPRCTEKTSQDAPKKQTRMYRKFDTINLRGKSCNREKQFRSQASKPLRRIVLRRTFVSTYWQVPITILLLCVLFPSSARARPVLSVASCSMVRGKVREAYGGGSQQGKPRQTQTAPAQEKDAVAALAAASGSKRNEEKYWSVGATHTHAPTRTHAEDDEEDLALRRSGSSARCFLTHSLTQPATAH